MDKRDQLLLARQQARAQKERADKSLLELHRKAANALAGPEAVSVRHKAIAQVEKWEAGHLCSAHYAQAWRGILSMPANAASEIMLQRDGEGPALRQNTPFGFLAHSQ